MVTGLLPWAVFRRDGNQNCLWVRNKLQPFLTATGHTSAGHSAGWPRRWASGKYALRQLAPLHRSELGAGVEPAVTAFAVSRIETEGLSSLVSLVPTCLMNSRLVTDLPSHLSGE